MIMTTAFDYHPGVRTALTRCAANYGRQSHGKKKSIREQLRLGNEHLGAMGFGPEDIREYRDKVSASRFGTAARRDWARLLDDVTAGEIGIVAIWETSRGSRTAEDWLAFLSLCRERGVLIYHEDSETVFDMRKPSDWKTLAIEGIDAHMYSEKLSVNVRRGTKQAALEGKPHGRVSFGYRRIYDDNTGEYVTQVPDEGEYPTAMGGTFSPAAVVRDLFAWLNRGGAVIAWCRRMNDLGVPSPAKFAASQRGDSDRLELYASSVWAPGTVNALITRQAYIGHREHEGQVVAANAWPALVDEGVYWEVRNLFANPDRRTNNRGAANALRFLSGVLRCWCGGRMHSFPHRRHGREYVSYSCVRRAMTTSEPGVKHSSISAKKVEAYVETIVVGFLTDPRSIARLAGASGADKAAVHARSEASRLRTELAQAKADALDPGKPFVSWSDYTDAAQALTPQIEKWEQAAQWSGVPADIAKMGGADAVAKWKACDVHAKRRIIKALFRFTVKPAGGAGAMYACDRVAVDPLV